jgi:cellulose biosynthesis protein BcsQ
MLGDTQSPVKRIGRNGSIIIEGTKTMGGRGWEYDYIFIDKNGALTFGSEQGNYAGGAYLTPSHPEYEERKEKQLVWIQQTDKEFYDLFIKEYTNAKI